MKHQNHGFTVLEQFIALTLIAATALLFWWQKQDLDASNRDSHSKTAINAIYYALEEAHYPTSKSYPLIVSKSTLPTVEEKFFKDPFGKEIGNRYSTLRYEPNRCQENRCLGYTLRANLEKESDFIKTSPQVR